MIADDTSREALVEQVGRVAWETSRADESTISYTGARIVAAAVVDAVVMPLVEGRDRLRHVAAQQLGRADAAIKRAEAAEARLAASDALLQAQIRAFANVTRVAVIHPADRLVLDTGPDAFDGVGLVIQDDGRTLKVFAESEFHQIVEEATDV